jgi:hypothetical protein
LASAGFVDIQEFLYDHAADEDGDGETNEFDEDFLMDLADQACAPRAIGKKDENFHPALFVCTFTEQDVIIRRWLQTGCRPLSLWLTASTWGWADNNPELGKKLFCVMPLLFT